MTDLERFIELYKSFGIDVKVNELIDQPTNELTGYGIYLNGCEGGVRIITYSDKLDGYTGFYSSVYFDKDGNFDGQGFYE